MKNPPQSTICPKSWQAVIVMVALFILGMITGVGSVMHRLNLTQPLQEIEYHYWVSYNWNIPANKSGEFGSATFKLCGRKMQNADLDYIAKYIAKDLGKKGFAEATVTLITPLFTGESTMKKCEEPSSIERIKKVSA